MTPRSIRRAAERRANTLARKSVQTPTVSEAQLTANRENAQLSTGPITEAGKRKSSLNAIKTGLTGSTVLLPTDDAARYQTHLQSYTDHFQPAGPEEHALMQSLADTTWRLARIPGLEMAIYAQGRIEFEEEFAEHEESIRPALIDAHTYLAYEKQIRNLHLQEARLVRRREKETAELRRLQQERAANGKRETVPNPSAVSPALSNVHAGIGFEFANDERELFIHPQSAEILPATGNQSPTQAAA